MQSHHLQGAHYLCLLQFHVVKIINYGSSAYDYISGDVVAYIGRVLVDVCMSHKKNDLESSFVLRSLCGSLGSVRTMADPETRLKGI